MAVLPLHGEQLNSRTELPLKALFTPFRYVMTEISSKASRDALGIDTISRGLVYAAHLLKSVSPTNPELATSVKFADEVLSGTLSIKATIDYDVNAFYSSGSDYLEGIQTLTNEVPTETFSPLTAASSGDAIPEDDTRVVTLESYFIWLLLLQNELELNKATPNVNFLQITQGITPTRFYKVFTFSVNYNPLVYAETGNIIEAIDVPSFVAPPEVVPDDMGNTGNLGNESNLAN